MFAKVFDTARRILSRSPSVQNTRTETREPTPLKIDDADEDMVTTRRGPVEDRTPQSSARKTKRALEPDSTPTESRKRQKPAKIEDVEGKAREQDENPEAEANVVEQSIMSPSLDNLDVGASEEKIESEPDEFQKEKLPIRRRSPFVLIPQKPSPPREPETITNPALEEVSSPTLNTKSDALDHSPKTTKATRKAKRKISSSKTPSKLEQSSSAAESLEGSNFPDEIPSSTFESEDAIDSTHATPRKAHIRFGSEEPIEPQGVTTSGWSRQSQVTTHAEDNESDSDEAPEEVTAASALSKTQAADAEKSRVLQALEDEKKRKRKERGKRIAEEQEQKKRNKLEKRENELATSKKGKRPETEEEPLGLDLHNLPTLLPESILETIDDKRPPTPPPTMPGMSAEGRREEKLRRHIKFLERGQKTIKDVKKGSLNVHVLAQQNAFLAPRVNKGTSNIRERWLKGRQAENNSKRKKMQFKKIERRSVSRGFIRGEE